MNQLDFNKHNISIFIHDTRKKYFEKIGPLSYYAKWLCTSHLTNGKVKSTFKMQFFCLNHPVAWALPIISVI